MASVKRLSLLLRPASNELRAPWPPCSAFSCFGLLNEQQESCPPCSAFSYFSLLNEQQESCPPCSAFSY